MSWIRRETEKGAVQYICPHCHDYHEFREDFGERTFSENYIFCRRCGARNGTGNAPTITQPNDPLTLEELREMVGQPVFLVTGEVSIHEQLVASWEILIDWEYSRFDFTRRRRMFHEKDYGITWIAYRYPPEGEEET